MVRAEELRLNNYVKSTHHEGLVTQVHSLLPSCIKLWANPFATYLYEELDPIPLTPEILVKCGFEKKDMIGAPYRDFYVQEFNHQYYGFSLGKEEYAITNPNKGILWIHHPFEKDVPFPKDDDLNAVMDWPESNEPFAWHIAYLHQLQNLIHSICGEELIINL